MRGTMKQVVSRGGSASQQMKLHLVGHVCSLQTLEGIVGGGLSENTPGRVMPPETHHPDLAELGQARKRGTGFQTKGVECPKTQTCEKCCIGHEKWLSVAAPQTQVGRRREGAPSGLVLRDEPPYPTGTAASEPRAL